MQLAMRRLTVLSGDGRPFLAACLLFAQVFGISLCHGRNGQEDMQVYTLYGMAECVSGQTDAPDGSAMETIGNSQEPSGTSPETASYCSSRNATGLVSSLAADPAAPGPAPILLAQERQQFDAPVDLTPPRNSFLATPKQPPRSA